MSLERRARPTLLRVEVPVAVDTGSVQLLIGTPAGEVADQNRFKFTRINGMKLMKPGTADESTTKGESSGG